MLPFRSSQGVGCFAARAAVSVLFAVTASAQSQVKINLATTTSPIAGQPGVTVLTLTCSGLPSGTILPANLSVSLQLAPGSTGPSLLANVSAFSPLPGSSGRITFQVTGPNVSAPTPYLVSVTGMTSTGTAFASSKPAALTINPAAVILSVNPSSGVVGQQNLAVTITGQYTNFVQGSTTANFGAGITVASVSVTSSTTAIATIAIAGNTLPGAQMVTVATGVQQASLPGGFTVIGTPKLLSVTPSSVTAGQGQNVPVTITGQYTHFAAGVSQVSFGADVSAGPLTVVSSTVITTSITLSTNPTIGLHTVSVTTGTEVVSCSTCFAVNPPNTSPAITQVSPNTGQQGQANLPVTITGQFTHFDMATTQVSFGPTITVAGIGVTNATTLTATINIPANATVGGYTVTVTTGSEVVSLANGFTVQQGPPVITLTLPTNLSFLNISPTTVNGTVSDPTATVTINSIPAPVSNGTFSIQLPLAEGPNLVTATATSASRLVSTATIQETLDTTPPHITITSPSDQFVTTAGSISVSGIVNDIVVGTVNAQQAQVTINGVAAQVANRTFLASNIPLNLGPNVIQAVARDQAGNSATTQITVTYQTPAAQPQIQLISGNNQTGVIGTLLPSPLVAALTDANNNPVANTPVIFKVLQNNGMVATGNGTPASSVVAMTNVQGQGQVQWTLGQRAGAGSDSVEAYAVGFSGTAIYTATSTLGVAGNIVIDTGNNQIGAIGQALPKPFIAVVVDSGNNRLPNVPVTFTVQQGGGSLTVPGGTNFTLNQNTPGATSVTVNTDSDGRAGVTLTLGYQEGNSNNVVAATFAGNQGFPAGFTSSGRAEGPAANTTISGVVLDNSNVPIPGVTIRVVLTNLLNSNSSSINAAATVQANAQGQFTIPNAPVGFVKLLVDGSTTTNPGIYPTLDYDMVTIAGQNNTLQMPIYLLPLNTANQLCVTATTGGGTLRIPEAPGFSLTFGPGQVTFPGGSLSGCVSVTVVHPDRVPMQPGFGQQPRFIVTIQPAGAIFNPPAPITLPNVDALAPRAVTEMYSFDHDIGSFVAIGTGTVSDDGQVIRSNQGVGVLKAGWHCGGNPNARGTVADCPVCQFCQGPNANSLSCIANPGAVGTSCAPAANPCTTGVCGGGIGVGNPPHNTPTGQCVVSTLNTGSCSVGGQTGMCSGGVCFGMGNQCPSTCNGAACVNGVCVNQACNGQNSGQCSMGGQAPGMCVNGQCVGNPNQCPAYCNGSTCLNGICTQTCTGTNNGALCNTGGSVPGICAANNQCQGQGNQCPASCGGASCTNGSCQCQLMSVSATANGNTSLTVGLTQAITFASQVVQMNCASLNYDWAFGNGTHSFGSGPVYTYPTPGIYNVTLTVACAGCNSVSTQLTVSVVELSSLSSSAPQEQNKPTHFFCLVGASDVVITATLNPSNAPPFGVGWTGGMSGVDDLHRNVSCSAAGDVVVTAQVGSGPALTATVHVIDAQPPPPPTSATKTWTNGGFVDPGDSFGLTIVAIGVSGVIAPTYDISAYFGTDRWYFRVNSISHTYKLGVHSRGRTDLPAGDLMPFPIPPNQNYTLVQAHTQARSDLDTSASTCGTSPVPPSPIPCAPLDVYYVNNAIIAHENAHVTHFYSPSFPFWNSQMELFKNQDVELTSVFVVFDCTDTTTTTGSAAISRERTTTWDAAIQSRHTQADQDEFPSSEGYAYSIENPAEDAVRIKIPVP
jgi:hypothetical protein